MLEGHRERVTRVAFLDGDRLVSAGGAGDGAIHLWQWNRTDPLVSRNPPNPEDMKIEDGLGVQVNAMAVSPDSRYVVVGRENGKLQRYPTADLRDETLLNPKAEGMFLAIEAIAYSPDGRSLAVSRLKHAARDYPEEFPRTECDIAIRSMPEGRTESIVRTTHDLAGALAFSPDGHFLAVGGGEAQEVAVKDLPLGPRGPG